MELLLLLLLAPSAAPGPAPVEEAANRHHLAHVTLVGPLEQARFLVEPMGETIVHAGLRAGERRSLVVPLPVWGGTEDLLPEVAVLGSGRASFEGWSDDNAAAERSWAVLPRGLRQRPRPAPPASPGSRGQGSGGAPVTALLLAAAALAVGWSQRARPGRSLLVSLAGAACVVALVAPQPQAPGLRVLERSGRSGAWMVVDVARGRIGAPPGTTGGTTGGTSHLRVECQPPRRRLTYEVDLAGSGGAPWSLRASRAQPPCTLSVLSLPTPGPQLGYLGPESNDLAALSEAWVRAADGSGWEALGPWPLGAALPAAIGAQDPPGGLNPALPLGQRVLVGRLAPGDPQAGGAGGAPAPETWLRLVGF